MALPRKRDYTASARVMNVDDEAELHAHRLSYRLYSISFIADVSRTCCCRSMMRMMVVVVLMMIGGTLAQCAQRLCAKRAI